MKGWIFYHRMRRRTKVGTEDAFFYFHFLFSIMYERLQVDTDAAEDIWKRACTWMETEVQPDSGLWVFVVAWRRRQDLASIFNRGLARGGECCRCLYPAYGSCVEFSSSKPAEFRLTGGVDLREVDTCVSRSPAELHTKASAWWESSVCTKRGLSFGNAADRWLTDHTCTAHHPYQMKTQPFGPAQYLSQYAKKQTQNKTSNSDFFPNKTVYDSWPPIKSSQTT